MYYECIQLVGSREEEGMAMEGYIFLSKLNLHSLSERIEEELICLVG